MTKADKLRENLEFYGFTDVKLKYVPIHGGCVEMQGYAGGWMVEAEFHGRRIGPESWGYNAEEVAEMAYLEWHIHLMQKEGVYI